MGITEGCLSFCKGGFRAPAAAVLLPRPLDKADEPTAQSRRLSRQAREVRNDEKKDANQEQISLAGATRKTPSEEKGQGALA